MAAIIDLRYIDDVSVDLQERIDVQGDLFDDYVLLSKSDFNQMVRRMNLLQLAILPLMPDDGIKDKLAMSQLPEIIE